MYKQTNSNSSIIFLNFLQSGKELYTLLSTIYFLIMTLSNILNRKLFIVFILSTILGPLLNYLSPSWGVLIAGFISGSLGFFYFRIKNDR